MFSKDPIILFWICKTASQYSYCSKMQLYELILLLLYVHQKCRDTYTDTDKFMYSKAVKTPTFCANIFAENSLRYCSIDF